MKTSLVLTLIGPDKPGLVERVSGILVQHQANWQRSSMSRLAGKFAGILIASVDATRTAELLADLEALEGEGLRVIAETDQQSPAERLGRALSLDLVGHDKPGIVREISRALAERGISVDKLETEVVSGSMSAELLFKAQADLLVPNDVDVDELQESLEAIAADLMVDISFQS
ncbi:glycine cleavage system protein R [Motiliproteus sp. SC1-56]|uniref:glycine cleavage system protein R n=1 Tax=Motiliproteus sp. SC1-56 TaxID=2799565 RepID=UPI001A8C4AD5|nr:ACT domain-containing protein [Motiliproteus sp. SC1-56]